MTEIPVIRIGTRGSLLALTQASCVEKLLENLEQRALLRRVIVTTGGDADKTTPLTSLGGRGVFVSELERALREERVDCVVHSCKDLPTAASDDLVIAAYPERANPYDLFVSARYATLSACPPGTRVGTGSPRRRVQARSIAPDVEFVEIRGNVDTRLQRVRDGTIDAIILAEAGLQRLGDQRTEHLHVERLGFDSMVPAAGQGVLAVQVRRDDLEVARIVRLIDDRTVRQCVEVERFFLAAVEGGCHKPVGAHARKVDQHGVLLQVAVAVDECGPLVRHEAELRRDETPQSFGNRVAREVLALIGKGTGR